MKKKYEAPMSMAKEIKGNFGRPKMSREEAKALIEKSRDEDRQMVKGIFRFYETPGGSLMFSFKKYKEDEVEHYTLIDGEVYTLPLGVAKHLNTNGWYPVHTYASAEGGQAPMVKVGQKVQRFGFQSLEFTGVSELEPRSDIITIERA